MQNHGSFPHSQRGKVGQKWQKCHCDYAKVIMALDRAATSFSSHRCNSARAVWLILNILETTDGLTDQNTFGWLNMCVCKNKRQSEPWFDEQPAQRGFPTGSHLLCVLPQAPTLLYPEKGPWHFIYLYHYFLSFCPLLHIFSSQPNHSPFSYPLP